MKTDCCNKTTWTSSSCSSAPCCDCGGASPRTTLPVPARTRCPRALIVVTLFCLRALARHLHRCCVACLCGPVVPSSPSTLDDCVNHRNDGSRPLGKIGWKPSCHTGTGTSQAIDSLISSRLLNASSYYIACDNRSPLAAQARNYRSVGGDPARSEPTYAYAASGPIQSIVPAPTVIADSSIKENTTPYAAPVLCASLILLKPTPRLAKALFLDSPVCSACSPLPHWLRSPPVAK